MIKDSTADRIQNNLIVQISESDEEYSRLLTLWESKNEGRHFREEVIGKSFSSRVGRDERIFADARDIIDRLVENMIKNVRQDIAEKKVSLWMFNRIEGEYIVFDREKCQEVAKNALFRHYQYFSEVSDAISAKKLDQIIVDELKNDHRLDERISLPRFYRETFEGGTE